MKLEEYVKRLRIQNQVSGVAYPEMEVKMPYIKMTQREYENDNWIDNDDDDEYEKNIYDEIDFEDV